jgi:peptide chain release factor 2
LKLLNLLGGCFNYEDKLKKLKEYDIQLSGSYSLNGYSDAIKNLGKAYTKLNKEIYDITKLDNIIKDLNTYISLWNDDDSTCEEISTILITILPEYTQFITELEQTLLLNGKYDKCNALLTIQSGAGGTEAQDWTKMLSSLYLKWIEKHNFKYTVIDFTPGIVAGFKNITIEIEGDNVYGLLRSEIGIHRLVRMSPFNSQNKRQTSFTSVFAYPEIDDSIVFEINSKDIRIDTFHATGSGGQGVNTTDSAVRITHLPTNIVVTCQNERSQIENKAKAMKVLKSRLYTYYEDLKIAERKSEQEVKADIEWGNQIRSYVFQPCQMVKDHRTNYEVGDMEKVMNGNIDEFINAWLKMKVVKNGA